MAAAACALLLPRVALADVFDFHSVEISALGSPTFDFSLDTASAVSTTSGFSFSDVTILKDGTASTGNTVGAAYGVNLSSPSFFLVNTDPSGTPFYLVNGSHLSFNSGTFAIADGATDGEGTLTITNSTVSAAPEPSAWILMIIGVGLAGAGLRFGRRRREALYAV